MGPFTLVNLRSVAAGILLALPLMACDLDHNREKTAVACENLTLYYFPNTLPGRPGKQAGKRDLYFVECMELNGFKLAPFRRGCGDDSSVMLHAQTSCWERPNAIRTFFRPFWPR